MEELYKLEVIDNLIGKYYGYVVYKWGRKHWWSLQKSWCFVEAHNLGKNYMCPEIHKKLKTVDDMFYETLKRIKEKYKFNEIHTTIISKV